MAAGALVLILLTAASPVLADKGIENENYSAVGTFRGFYREPPDSLDVLFLGTSNAYCAFSPEELSRFSGLKSYNLASSQQSLLTSYYWLKEALRYQHPKAVVLETFYCFYKVGNEGSLHKAFDWMNNSPVKAEAVRELCRSFSDDSVQYHEYQFLLPALRYHDRWSQLDEMDMVWTDLAAGNGQRGYCPRYEKSEREEFITIPQISSNVDIRIESVQTEGTCIEADRPLNDGSKFAVNAPQQIPDFQREYLDRITDLCRKNSIHLILVKTPSVEWTPAQHNAVSEYAGTKDSVDFIDFNMTDTYMESGYDFAEDNADSMHANVSGAVKLTDAVGKYMECAGIVTAGL